MAQNSAVTRSIDVGSMFLMDLSVNESESANESFTDVVGAGGSIDDEMVFPMSIRVQPDIASNKSTNIDASLLASNTTTTKSIDSSLLYHKRKQYNDTNKYHRGRGESQQHNELLDNSLDRLASVINHNMPTGGLNNTTTTTTTTTTLIEPQPLPEFSVDGHQQSSSSSSTASSSSSLSDESFVPSSGGDEMNSLSSASYSGSSEADDEERASTTTREDSGILDMKDLGSQKQFGKYGIEQHADNHINNNKSRSRKDRPFSNDDDDITTTNLINKSANNHHDINFVTTTATKQLDRSNNPTNNKSNYHLHNNHHHHHHHHHNNNNNHNQSSKRSVSASLPIQVPTRQMKKDLNKLKLSLISKNLAIPAVTGLENNKHNNTATSSTTNFIGDDDTQEYHHQNAAIDDFDEFLEQEYNENHQNHYPMNQYDDERLRADEDPMRLFESIQALARSLNEDTELFGSLPPKRMLESPIRSLALA